jgi:hypothetical protein
MFDADLLTLNGPSRDPHKLAALTSLHASLLSSSRAPLLDLIPARRLFDSAGLFRTLSRCLSSCPEPKRVFESASPERDLLAIGCLSAFLRCPEFLLVLSKGWEAQTDSGRSLGATQKDVVNETLLAAFFRTILPDPAPAFVERVLRGGTEEAAVATAAYGREARRGRSGRARGLGGARAKRAWAGEVAHRPSHTRSLGMALALN